MLETVQEIAIYIHRFHNLDLFQQGWYRIKITMRWEDSMYTSSGTPARVVQYEAPDLGPDDISGVWRIDDVDNSFCTQPFRIKYARQDVLLSVMISFNLSLGKHEGPPKSAVILRFELLYNPVLEKGSDLQGSPEAIAAAVHEFRIPPKALLGLHSYCPVHFDTFHAVLVELSVHIVLLKDGTYRPPLKVPSDSGTMGAVQHGSFDGNNHLLRQEIYADPKSIVFLKAMLAARDILIDELHKISKAINQTIDLTDISSNLGDVNFFGSVIEADLGSVHGEASEVRIETSRVTSEPHNGFRISNGSFDFESDVMLQAVTKKEMLDAFHSLGNQISVLWNAFLKFHRANTTKTLEYLRDVWASDRRAEWSIWMVYSKVEMPHHILRSGLDESSHNTRGKSLMSRKLSHDPAQTAMTRAERHRRSIAQMRINNRAIQDMHIFGEPLRIPVILVDRVVNARLRTTSGNSYFSALDRKDTFSIRMGTEVKAGNKFSGAGAQRSGRVLKIVVFVHGFQGHHLDLRLVRNQWLLIDPGVDCLMSEVNEDRTSGDFREMGSRLAEEVIAFLKKKMDKLSRSGGHKDIKLSFVGHSIGNVIIRTALTDSRMEPFLKYLYTYMSVSGPHLGYLYSSNSLFNSGVWLMKKLKGTQSIHQLTFTDEPDLQNTFLYKLCKQKTLEHFRNIILLSSPQFASEGEVSLSFMVKTLTDEVNEDGYVPYHSARIEMCQASSWDNSKKGKIFMEMLNDCLDQIRTPSSQQRMFVRCDVNFDTSTQGKNLNTIIGRAAHIEFLETDVFARFIMWSFPELFR